MAQLADYLELFGRCVLSWGKVYRNLVLRRVQELLDLLLISKLFDRGEFSLEGRQPVAKLMLLGSNPYCVAPPLVG